MYYLKVHLQLIHVAALATLLKSMLEASSTKLQFGLIVLFPTTFS